MKSALSINLLLILLFASQMARAQTNEFTYQGKLTDSGTPSATYDFEFRLCDSASAIIPCNPALPTIQRFGVPVINGIFTVTLDFDFAYFSLGADRFLQISVRRNSGEAWTQLSPRQKITSSPYSLKSFSATNADNALQLDGVAANQFVRTNDARLSDDRNPTPNSPNYIQNTTTPQANTNFNIGGNGTVGTDLLVGQNATVGNGLSVGTNAQIGNSLSANSINASGNLTAGNTNVAALTSTRFSTSGNVNVGGNTILNGDLGVGTSLPSAKLHVSGSGIFNENLTVAGSTTIGNSLSVAASGNFGSSLSANSLSVNGNLTAGNTTLGTLNASSLTTTGNVVAQGNAAFSGTLRLGAFTANPAVCTVASAGTIYYRANDPAIVLCNGTNWVRFASAAAQPIAEERFEIIDIIGEQQRQINELKEIVCSLKPDAKFCQ